MALVIALANQKGGCGKTTLSMMVGGTLALAGKSVLIVDADPQGTASRWAKSSPDDNPFPATVVSLSEVGSKLHREVTKLARLHEFVIIDCPPAVASEATQSALIGANLVLVPIIPSPPDLWASLRIQELIKNAMVINSGLRAFLVLNQVDPRHSLEREVSAVLQEFDIPRFRSSLGYRVAYRNASMYGLPVHWLSGEKKAIGEVDALVEELLTHLYSEQDPTPSEEGEARAY